MSYRNFIMALARGARGKEAAEALILPEIFGTAMPVDSGIEQTVSGATPLYLPNALAKPMLKCETNIVPVQEMHGYDSPWPAGGGKNKLPITATTTTVSGVTFTINDDGSISTSNTATDAIIFLVATDLAIDGTNMALNGCPSGGSDSTYYMTARISGAWSSQHDTGSGLALYGTIDRVAIVVSSGTNMNGLTFYPMIRSTTETNTFAPYSNICPISGWQGATVTVSGANLMPYPYYDDRTTIMGVDVTDNGDGSITFDGTVTGGTLFFNLGTSGTAHEKMYPSGTYTLSGGIANVRIIAVKNSMYFVSTGSDGSNATFILTEASKLYFYLNIPNGTVLDNVTISPMLNVGSSALPFTPYRAPSTASVTFGQTVYGGTAEIVAGTGSEEWESITLNGSEWWGGSGAHGMYTPVYALKRANNYLTLIKCESLTVCDSHQTGSFASNEYAISGWDGSGYAGQNWIYIAAAGINNTTDLKAWLAQNPVKVVFVKATPLTYTFQPAKVSTSKGDNYVWSDCGDEMSVTYKGKATE